MRLAPPLHTHRLKLEPYTDADEEDFVALFMDDRVSWWMGDGPMPEADVRALFRRVFTDVYPRGADASPFLVWAVREMGRMVGHAEVKPTDVSGGHEVIYALAPDCWGRGLGSELADALAVHALDALRLPAVYATVAEANTASLAVLRRTGFQPVRDLPQEDGSRSRLLIRRS